MHQLLSNQFVSGGLTLMLVGGLLASLRKIPEAILEWARDNVLYTVEIDNTDSSFSWVRSWVSSNCRTRYVSAGVVPPEGGYANERRGERPRFYFCPRGLRIIKFRGRRLIVWTSKEKIEQQNGYRERIVFQCLGAAGDLFEQLFNAAYDHAQAINGETVEIWIPDGVNWQLADRKSVRYVNTLVLPSGIRECFFDDAKAFLEKRDWYRERGIPFRRGYLLHGPPGNGKSSLVHVLASELKTNISIANLSTFDCDSDLMTCLSKVPKGNILLLEDIDTLFEERKASGTTKITFSALLNAIDGVCAKEGGILVMTSNRPEVLDAALTRAGRADVHLLIPNASRRQTGTIFRKFFPDAPEGLDRHFAEQISEGEMSMAAIQGLLLSSRDAGDAVRAAHSLDKPATIAA